MLSCVLQYIPNCHAPTRIFCRILRGPFKAISRASVEVTEALQFVSSLVVADVESYGLEGSNGIDIEEAVGAETLGKEAG